MESVVFSLDVGESVCLVVPYDLVATGRVFDRWGFGRCEAVLVVVVVV